MSSYGLMMKMMSFIGKSAIRSVDKMAQDPKGVQEALLMTLLEENKDTEYGRAHDFSKIRSIEDYQKMVPIQGEVEFMRNYISLMKLRCNEKTVVNSQFEVLNPSYEVAPLLFISLIENAFKHGVSSNRPSTIDISLKQDNGQLVFCCDNTNYPKDDADRSGSGIGLENTRRRLELMYHDRYQWEQSLEGEIYHVKITIT